MVVGLLQSFTRNWQVQLDVTVRLNPVVLLWLQSLSLGLGEQWEQVKAAYAQANQALGDIVKVSPASLHHCHYHLVPVIS